MTADVHLLAAETNSSVAAVCRAFELAAQHRVRET